jgi:hypothetical protein
MGTNAQCPLDDLTQALISLTEGGDHRSEVWLRTVDEDLDERHLFLLLGSNTERVDIRVDLAGIDGHAIRRALRVERHDEHYPTVSIYSKE